MSESTPNLPGTAGQVRAFAVRLADDLRSQLDVIAQLNERTVTEEIRVALEAWIQRARTDPLILARADSVRADIEREARARRGAIEAIFASGDASRPRPSKKEPSAR